MLEKPVASESFGVRNALLSQILYKEKDIPLAMDGYRQVCRQLKKGEKLDDLSVLFHDILEGERALGRGVKETLSGLAWVRKEFSGDPSSQKLFGRIFKCLGDRQQALDALKIMNSPDGPCDTTEKKEAFLKLLETEKNVPRARDDFTFLTAHLDSCEKVERVTGSFVYILDHCQHLWYGSASEKNPDELPLSTRKRGIYISFSTKIVAYPRKSRRLSISRESR